MNIGKATRFAPNECSVLCEPSGPGYVRGVDAGEQRDPIGLPLDARLWVQAHDFRPESNRALKRWRDEAGVTECYLSMMALEGVDRLGPSAVQTIASCKDAFTNSVRDVLTALLASMWGR